MSVSLTRILANAGIPLAMNALVPGSGMADMFVRNAGTGIARGLVNSPSGPQRVGGRGDPAGAMPTRKFGSTRESVGELKSGFKDWLVDPLQAKKEKREQARDTALAVRLGITGGEYSLTHRPAMSLIKKRSGDVQTNIMILQFRVQQFMARNLSSIASTLGVQKSKIGHEEPDPNRSWFGSLLSSIHKDLQENKVFSTLESVGKHIVNIGSILNPFTMGARAKSGVKSFGEFIQKLAMGKEGYEMMKDPTKLYEKAGLKQDFQTKSLNLMKINNEYQRHQLNMLYNLVNISKEILGTFGGSYKDQTLDLVHDEFDGSLKTGRQLRQAQGMRELALHTTMQAASRKSIVGKIGGIFGGLKNLSYDFAEKVSPSKATDRDKYALDYMYNTPGFFEDIRGLSSRLDRFIEKVPSKLLDWYDSKNQSIADRFKQLIEEAISQPNLQPDEAGTAEQKKKKLKKLKSAYQLSKKQAVAQVGFGSSYNATKVVNNLATGLTGRQAADIGKGEARNKYNTYLRSGGDFGIAGIHSGAPGENVVAEYHKSGVIPTLLRSIPVFGAIFGAAQQHQVAGLASKYDEALRSPRQEPNLKKMFGYTPISNGIGFGPGSGSGVQRLMNVRVEEISSNITDKFKAILEDAFVGFSVLLRAALEHAINNNLSRVLGNAGRNVVKTFFDRVKEIADKNQDKYAISVIIKGPAIPLGQTTQRGSTQNQPQGLPQSPSAHAHGNVFSGGNISDYSGQIVSRPTFFNYDELHKFAQGAGVMGEGDKPEGIFPLERNKKGDLGISAPSIMRVILVDTSGKPLSISLPQNQIQTRKQIEKTRKLDDKSQNKLDFKPLKTGFDSQLASLMRGASADSIIHDLSYQKYFNENFMARKIPLLGSVGKLSNLFSGITGTQPKEKKQIDENDNITTTAERQKSIEEKQEKKEEEKKEQKQEANEEEKKTLLQRIADYINPESKFNKLREKLRKKKEEGGFSLGSLFGSISGMIPDFMKKLGIGLLGAGLLKLLPDGGKEIIKSIFGFAWDSIKYVGGVVWDLLKEHGPGLAKDAWEAFKEHPLIGAGLITTMFPGTVGTLISKIGIPIIKRFPLSIPLVVGMGGMVYSLVDAFSHSKDETGGFSIGNFLKEFFFGSDGGIGGTLSKAASWGWMGAKIGAMFGGVGAVPGMLVGAALGTLVGSTESRDEQGNFSWSKFFKNLAVGNDAAGGLANGGKQFLKWGLVGGAFGGPIGFLLAGSIGGLLGVVGADGFSKLYKMGEESGQTVAKFFKWEKGSFAYKAATCGAANSIPYLGAFVFGALGSILDLGSMLIKGLWGWVKSFLPQSVIDRIEGNKSEYEKKFDEQNKIEVKATEKDADVQGNVFDREYKMNVNEKDATYINEAKTENEKLKRYREIEAKNNRKKHWGTEATKGINGKKYDPEKYIALKEKWAEEDKKINDAYSHEIDVPWSAPGIKDFNTTPDNAQQYKDLYDINPDDALKFAKGVFDKQEEERKKREAERESALKKIEVGSSPDDLKLDAQRKSSSVPAAMSVKLGVGDDDDNDDMGSNVDVTELQEKFKGATFGEFAKKVLPKPNVYDLTDDTTQMQATPQEMSEAHGRMMEQIREGQKVKPGDPLYKRNVQKYNEAAQNIDLSSAGLGLSAPGPDPSSVPAAAKASEDASKKKDENKGKSGSSGPAATPATAQAAPAAPAAAPVETPAPAAPSGENPASTPSGGGQLNWIENLISKTIQNTFKAGEAIFGAAKTAYNTAQQTLNGGPGAPGDPGGGGAVGSWGGGFSNAEYLPGKPGAASLGTHFITAKPKDPRNRPGRNNNPLNVKLSKKGLDKADEQGHRIFGNVDDGIRGNFWQLQRYINGTYLNGKFGQLNTARKIIPVWAPVKDGNNPTAYLQHLQQYGVDIDAPIDLNNPSSLDPLAKLMSGMAREEGWGIINPEEIKKVLTYGNHQGAPGTAQSTGDAVAAPTSAPEAVRNYLAIMGRNAQGARYDNDLRNKPGYYDCSSFTARSLADAGIFPRSVVDGKNAPTTGDLPIYLKRYGFKFHPYNFRGVKTAPPELQPGDILTANKAETGGSMGHVVTYWGDNKIIAAHRKRTNPEVGIKPFYTSKQGGYWRYSPGGGSNPEDLLNKTGQTTTENTILPNSAKTPSLFKKLKKTLGSAKLSWPTISSKVNSDYGTRDPSQFAGAKGKISRNHGGVDIQAAEGDPVYSTMSGTVVGTDPDYGTIEVQHPNGWLSKYLHLGKFIARAGEQVKSGQIIGEAGGVGKGGKTDAFNPHLHFELIKGKTKIPPLPMVAAAGLDQPTKKEQLENSNAAGYGGPDFTPRINKQMNEYLENNGVGGPEISVKSDNRVIAELKKLQVIMMGVMKAAGKPSIAVSAPQQSGGGNPQNQVDESGASDAFTDSAFSQIGGLLPNLNVSMTGLGTSIA